MKAAVILSGCGVFDGAEIHESVFALLALSENDCEYSIFAPDKEQHHVVNHMNGEEMPEVRNVLTEAARIARGDIEPISNLEPASFDFLVIPGGFGAAKNLNQWALSGPEGDIDDEVARVIVEFVNTSKPVCGLCMGPTVIAQALQGSSHTPTVTMGSTIEASPYDIAGINKGLAAIGTKTVDKTIREIQVDLNLKVVTAPCYMMEASLIEVRNNIKSAIDETVKLAAS